MSYFVVNHVSDENKTEGLVESYQMVSVQDEAGNVFLKRLNFVHWPTAPHPFVHEEWNENLVFANVYVPEDDNGDTESEEDEEETVNDVIANLLENDYPEVYAALHAEAMLDFEEEEDEVEDDGSELEATN